MIQLEHVGRTYRNADREAVHALQDIELRIDAGEMVAITGPSGSGLSTLMNVLACLDPPHDGRYLLDGTDVTRLSKRQLARARGQKIGFVFQTFSLIANSTVQQNVELPLIYRRTRRVRRRRAREALDRVGLRGHYDDMPIELFAAQQQKALIARALINDPPVLLDDEPTSDLDAESAAEVMALFIELNQAGRTIIYATHDEEAAACAQRIVRLRGGRIVSDRNNVPQHPKRQPPKLRAV